MTPLPFKPQWVSVLKKGRIFKYRRSELSSPRIFGDGVYVGSDSGYFYCIHKKTGRKLWRFQTVGAVNSTPSFGADGGTVYFGDDKGILYSLTSKEGKELWRATLGAEVMAAPAVWRDRVFVTTVEGRMVSLKSDIGEILWDRSRPRTGLEMTLRGNSAPVINTDSRGAVVYVGYSDGFFEALDATSGHLVWQRQLSESGRGFQDVDSPPVADGSRLFVATADGDLFLLSRSDGRTLWKQSIGTSVSLLIQDGNLYVSGSDGSIHALDKGTGEEIWKTKIAKSGHGALTAPLIHEGILALGLSDSTINFVRLSDGRILARRFARKGISSNPVIDNDRIFYLSNGGRLYSLKMVDDKKH